MIGQSLPTLFAAFASLERIQGFLQLPEKDESESEDDVVETEIPDLVDVSDDGAKISASIVGVSLRRCIFTWDNKEKTPVLTDLTLDLAPRELHMVVGAVASVRIDYLDYVINFKALIDISQGKSSLLMSILRETTLVEGAMHVNAGKVHPGIRHI
jgi:hypothetical protein